MKESRKERNKKKEIQKVCLLQACDEYKCTFTVEAQIEFERSDLLSAAALGKLQLCVRVHVCVMYT